MQAEWAKWQISKSRKYLKAKKKKKSSVCHKKTQAACVFNLIFAEKLLRKHSYAWVRKKSKKPIKDSATSLRPLCFRAHINLISIAAAHSLPTHETQSSCLPRNINAAAGVATVWHTSPRRFRYLHNKTRFSSLRTFLLSHTHTHAFFHFFYYFNRILRCCCFVFMEIAVQLFRQISRRISISLDGEVVVSAQIVVVAFL